MNAPDPTTIAAGEDPAPSSARVELLARLMNAIADHTWAFQGAPEAPARWIHSNDLQDLDLWVAGESRLAVSDALQRLGAIRVGQCENPRRLRHDQWWMPGPARGAIIDVTIGDLRVGPQLLCRADTITLAIETLPEIGSAPVLTGTARVMDLAVRPLLRGRIPDAPRRADAYAAWMDLDRAELRSARSTLDRVLGRHHAGYFADLLRTGEDYGLLGTARRRLIRRTLSPANLRSSWAQRAAILGYRTGPLGLPAHGVVVALVGTDGSGKSTLSNEVTARLGQLGFGVRNQYFGMARANLPGVATLRRLARGGDPEVLDAQPPPATTPATDTTIEGPRLLRRLGAWAYAADYLWRVARRVAPGRRAGEIVICDRWITDLRRTPWPNSAASTWLERMVRTPEVMVLAWAPPTVIHARKPERTLAGTYREQSALEGVLEDHAARTQTLRAITDPAVGGDPAGAVIAKVIAAAHRA